MTGAEGIALAAGGVVVVAALLVARSLRRLHVALAAVRADLDQLSTSAASADEVGASLGRINTQLDRLASAAGLPELEDHPRRVSRVPVMLRSRGVVKAMALGSGTAHVARRLRNGNGNGSRSG